MEKSAIFYEEVGKLKQLSEENGLINEIYHYILHHISEAITTDHIAQSLYMSRSHLSTLFKKKYQKNLIDYIHEVKISKATELLKDRSKSINQIADYLGYSSSSHFTRMFTQFEKMSPKKYRSEI